MKTQLDAMAGSGENTLNHGSNPCRTANFSSEVCGNEACRTVPAPNRTEYETQARKMQFPVVVCHRFTPKPRITRFIASGIMSPDSVGCAASSSTVKPRTRRNGLFLSLWKARKLPTVWRKSAMSPLHLWKCRNCCSASKRPTSGNTHMELMNGRWSLSANRRKP